MKAFKKDVALIDAHYEGRKPFYGELHDHSSCGDGKNTLAQWKTGMEALGMDFATIVDHRQVEHMYHRDFIDGMFLGGTTSFEGQRLCVSVGDFHGSLMDPAHTYRMNVVTERGVVYSQEISCYETSYHVLDTDINAAYYYIEIYDTTDNYLLAIGNPIWNADK